MKTFKGALIGLFFLTVFHFEMRDKLRINALLLHNHTQPTANRWLEIDTFFYRNLVSDFLFCLRLVLPTEEITKCNQLASLLMVRLSLFFILMRKQRLLLKFSKKFYRQSMAALNVCVWKTVFEIDLMANYIIEMHQKKSIRCFQMEESKWH